MKDIKDIVFLRSVFGWRDGKVERWKSFLFCCREKWEYKKRNLYKFTIMPLDMLFDCFTWLLMVVQTKQKRSKAKERDRLIKLWQYGNWTSNKLFMLVFSPIRRNGFFVGLGGKCPSPTKKFPHLLSLPNNTHFYFLFYFLSFIFHPPYFTSNQT